MNDLYITLIVTLITSILTSLIGFILYYNNWYGKMEIIVLLVASIFSWFYFLEFVTYYLSDKDQEPTKKLNGIQRQIKNLGNDTNDQTKEWEQSNLPPMSMNIPPKGKNKYVQPLETISEKSDEEDRSIYSDSNSSEESESIEQQVLSGYTYNNKPIHRIHLEYNNNGELQSSETSIIEMSNDGGPNINNSFADDDSSSSIDICVEDT